MDPIPHTRAEYTDYTYWQRHDRQGMVEQLYLFVINASSLVVNTIFSCCRN